MLPPVTPKNSLGGPASEILGAGPVGLGDDADPETLRFQHPTDHRHAEAGMVDIGVAGDQDDVAGVPAQSSISAMLIGKSGAVPKRCAQYFR